MREQQPVPASRDGAAGAEGPGHQHPSRADPSGSLLCPGPALTAEPSGRHVGPPTKRGCRRGHPTVCRLGGLGRAGAAGGRAVSLRSSSGTRVARSRSPQLDRMGVWGCSAPASPPLHQPMVGPTCTALALLGALGEV